MKSHGVQGTLLQNVAVFNYLKLQWSFELERVLFCLEKWRSWTGLFDFLLTFPQKESASLRKDFLDFTRNSMSPKLGVPCLVIRGKEFVNKGLTRPPCLSNLILCPPLLVVLLFSVWWCILHGIHSESTQSCLWLWVLISLRSLPYHIKHTAVLERRLPGYECSVCKRENPSSATKHPHKMLKMSVYARDPSTGSRLPRKNCLGFQASQCSQKRALSRVTEIHCHKGIRWQAERDQGKRSALPLLVCTQASEASAHAHAQAGMRARTHTHTH